MNTVKIESIQDLKPGDRVVVNGAPFAPDINGLTIGDVHTVERVAPAPGGPDSAGSVSLVGVGPNPNEWAPQPGLYGFLLFDKVVEDEAAPPAEELLEWERELLTSEPNVEPEAPEAPFKVGDRVTLRDHHTSGGQALTAWEPLQGMGATVTSVDPDDGSVNVRWDEESDVDSGMGWSPGWLQAFDEPEAPEAPFKVGDRVRCKRGGPGFSGLLGTITDADQGSERYPAFLVEWDNPPSADVRQCDSPHGGAWGAMSLELVTDQPEATDEPEAPEAPFKVGDRARITGNTSGHRFGTGVEVTVTDIFAHNAGPHVRAKDDNNESWYVRMEDMELVLPVIPDADVMTEREEELERNVERLSARIGELQQERTTLAQAASDERRRLCEEIDTMRQRINNLCEERAELQAQGRRDTERIVALNEQAASGERSRQEAWAEVARLTRVLDYTRAECVTDEAARQRSFGFEDGTRPV